MIIGTTAWMGTGTAAFKLAETHFKAMQRFGSEQSMLGYAAIELHLVNLVDSSVLRTLGRYYLGPSADRVTQAYGMGGDAREAELSRHEWEPLVSESLERLMSRVLAGRINKIFEIIIFSPQSAGHARVLAELLAQRNQRQHIRATRIGIAVLPDEADKRNLLAGGTIDATGAMTRNTREMLLELVDDRFVDNVIFLDNRSPYAQQVGGWRTQDVYAMEALAGFQHGIFADTSNRSGVDIATTLHRGGSFSCFGIAHMPISVKEKSSLQRVGRALVGLKDELSEADVVNSTVQGLIQALEDPNNRTIEDPIPYRTNKVTYGVGVVPRLINPRAISGIQEQVQREMRRQYPNLEVSVVMGNMTLPYNANTGLYVLAGVVIPLSSEPKALVDIENGVLDDEVEQERAERRRQRATAAAEIA